MIKFVKNLFLVVSSLTVFAGLALESSLPARGSVLAQTADPVLVGAGDIAVCSTNRDESTAQLLDNIPGTIFTVGDNAYPNGTLIDFNNCYEPSWGRHKDRTRPAAGNHDYNNAGAQGYYTYFGSAASPLDTNCTSNCLGYYSYELGEWHIIVLNSEIALGAGSAQEQWLRADLAAHQNACTLAYWHKPLFGSGFHGDNPGMQPFWNALYEYGADVVLNGHEHIYERYALQSPTGQADPAHGIREFVVGTGGVTLNKNLQPLPPNNEVRNNTTHGVLKLTLHVTSYDWEFVPIAGQTFTDSGSANCVDRGQAPTETPMPGGTPTATQTTSGSDLIFEDGFESGSLSAWTSNVNDLGDLSVSPAAALVGSRGMQALIDDVNTIYVTDDSPNAEPRYRARFYFDPNSISMGADIHVIQSGLMGTSNAMVRVEFRQFSGSYQLRGRLVNDGATWISSNWFSISDAPHFVELDWRAATGVAANNGGLTLWIDGTQQADLGGVDNDTARVDRIRLGAVGPIGASTTGTYYFDAFEARRQTYIGPAP